MLILFKNIALWIGYYHITKAILRWIVWPALVRFWHWNATNDTLLYCLVALFGLKWKKWRTGWYLAERADELTYTRFLRWYTSFAQRAPRYAEPTASAPKWKKWIGATAIRWLLNDRLKKYPGYEQFPIYKFKGTNSEGTIREVAIRASTAEVAYLIAKELNPHLNFTNQKPGWANTNES